MRNVTVEPPIKSMMAPKCGTDCAANKINPTRTVLRTALFQVKSETMVIGDLVRQTDCNLLNNINFF